MRRIYGISKIALRGVLQKPLRSFLTILTAAIGIASVVATVSIIDGANSVIDKSLMSLGPNIIVVQNKSGISRRILKSATAKVIIRNLPKMPALPGGKKRKPRNPLDMNDVKRLKKLFSEEGVIVSPAMLKRLKASVGYEGREPGATIMGTDTNYLKMYENVPMAAGKSMTAEQVRRGDNVCVLDQAMAFKLFPLDVKVKDMVGRTLTLSAKDKELTFKIIGILKDPHVLRARAGKRIDVAAIARELHYTRLEFMNVYVPLKALNGPGPPEINSLLLASKSVEEVESLMTRVKGYMSKRGKHVRVWGQKTWILAARSTLDSFTSFGHFVWIMILAVSLIMIITITLVSVRERYYEIAVRITEGATRIKIILQLALESLYLSLVAGIIGVGLGHIVIAICERFLIRWDAMVSYKVLLLAFSLSVLIGILTSIPSARHAASLNPVDVLRMH